MKIEWQPDDIVPGRIVGKPDRRERWMIGYHAAKPSAFCLISLTDGEVQPATDKAGLALALNTSGDIPAEFFSDITHAKRGAKGGAARAAALSPERRSEIASTAGRARWDGERSQA